MLNISLYANNITYIYNITNYVIISTRVHYKYYGLP